MSRWLRSIVGLITVAAIAGTPAMLSACVALCMPAAEAPRAAWHTADASTPAHGAPDGGLSMTGCAEHPTTGPTAPAASQVSRTSGHCCADGLTAASPAVAAERADTRAGAAGVLTPVVTWTSAPLARATVRVAHDRGSPPPLLRRSSVLRI